MATDTPRIVAAILRELDRARAQYPAFHSQHEGASVLREEHDELWDAVRRSKSLRASGTTAIEAVQIAAMAIRFIVDLCDEDEFLDTYRGYERAR